MVGLVALITLIALVVRSHQPGISWPVAMLTGVRRAIEGLLAGFGLIVVLALGLHAADAALRPVADAALAILPEGQPPASRASGLPAMPQATRPAAVIASLPTPTPRVVKMAYTAPALQATHTPETTPPETTPPVPTPRPTEPPPTSTPPPATATPTPASDRDGCDPAYPDARTCIPPGPPWDQGCAITPERRFTVLPPDPQGLDHDQDGIGCEPVT